MKQLTDRMKHNVDRQALRRHLDWFAGVRRDTGGSGEQQAARYIEAELTGLGLPVLMHEFDAWLSFPRAASLQLAGSSDSFECLTHAFTASTPADGVTAEVVPFDPNAGDPAETGGRIALVDGICTPITVLRLSRAGAAGIIFSNPGEAIHYMTATTVWGTPAADQLDRLPQLPAVSVRNSAGERLRALLADGPVRVTLRATVETGWYPSLLPEVRIEGSGPEADQFVLVGAHYCSWEYGITDNATGVACLLELARLLRQEQGSLRRGVRIAWWPGHSHGRYAGSGWYADRFFHELAANCITYHNVDSPGVRGATHYVARHTTAEVEQFCLSLIESATGQKAEVNRPSRAADQSFLANGVPAFSTYPFLPEGHEDRRPWTGGAANAWWWHTSADTIDKADTDILALDTAISTAGVLHLASTDRLPLDTLQAAKEIRSFAEQLAEAAAAHLDASAFRAAAVEYEQLATELSMVTAPATNVRLNRLNMALSRHTLPLVYSRGGRYVNDPAELSPIMRNNRNTQFPGLADGLHLSGHEDSGQFGFIKAGLTRQLNRATDQLRSAVALARSGLRELQASGEEAAMS